MLLTTKILPPAQLIAKPHLNQFNPKHGWISLLQVSNKVSSSGDQKHRVLFWWLEMVVPHEVVGDGGEGRAMKQGEVRRDGVKLWHWLPSFPFPERVSINFFWPCPHYAKFPRPGIEPETRQWQQWILNPLTTRELPGISLLNNSLSFWRLSSKSASISVKQACTQEESVNLWAGSQDGREGSNEVRSFQKLHAAL